MQVLEDLKAATKAALDLVGPRVVTSVVLHQAVDHAGQHGIGDAGPVLTGARVDLEALIAETVVRHASAGEGWPAIAAAFGISTNRARALYGAAVKAAQDAAGGRFAGDTNRDTRHDPPAAPPPAPAQPGELGQ